MVLFVLGLGLGLGFRRLLSRFSVLHFLLLPQDLLLLLVLVPVVAVLQGGKGAAPAVVFSSLRPLLDLGRARRSRLGPSPATVTRRSRCCAQRSS